MSNVLRLNPLGSADTAFLKWRRANTSPTDEAVAKARRYLWMEVALFPPLPAFAAAMARGYGVF